MKCAHGSGAASGSVFPDRFKATDASWVAGTEAPVPGVFLPTAVVAVDGPIRRHTSVVRVMADYVILISQKAVTGPESSSMTASSLGGGTGNDSMRKFGHNTAAKRCKYSH